jgi:hypothetical protein
MGFDEIRCKYVDGIESSLDSVQLRPMQMSERICGSVKVEKILPNKLLQSFQIRPFKAYLGVSYNTI